MPTPPPSPIALLATFIDTQKFRGPEPSVTHAVPVSETTANILNDALNACAAELATLVQNQASDTELKACIATSLRAVEAPLDNNVRDALYAYYSQLGAIVGVDIDPLLDRWLHGFLLHPL